MKKVKLESQRISLSTYVRSIIAEATYFIAEITERLMKDTGRAGALMSIVTSKKAKISIPNA